MTSVWSTSAPFLSVQCWDVTALKRGWMLGDAPLCLMFPLIFSVTSVYSSSSSLVQDGVHSQLQYRSPMITWCSIPITVSPFSIFFHHFIIFHHFMILTPISWYIGMHPTLAGFYPFLLGSPARRTFLSYLCLYICLGFPARSRLSCSAVALTEWPSGAPWEFLWILGCRPGTPPQHLPLSSHWRCYPSWSGMSLDYCTVQKNITSGLKSPWFVQNANTLPSPTHSCRTPPESSGIWKF